MRFISSVIAGAVLKDVSDGVVNLLIVKHLLSLALKSFLVWIVVSW